MSDETPPDNRPPGADAWPAWAWERFQQERTKRQAATDRASAMETRLAELEAAATTPPAPTPPAEDPAMNDTITAQLAALQAQLSAQTARADRAERMGALQGVDPAVAEYILRDYDSAAAGGEAPPFADFLGGLKEHPLYKAHLTPPAPVDPAATPPGTLPPPAAQPIRPNAGRTAPPTGATSRYTDEAVQAMSAEEKRQAVPNIAAQLRAEGGIKMSDALAAKLGIR
jgi:hypothetical protein